MQATRTQLEAVLDAVERLLNAREAQMVTSEEWDAVEHAVAACSEPPTNERAETFTVDDARDLVRSVAPVKGERYQHRCPADAFEAVAHAVAEAKRRFNLEDLRRAANIPWTQAAVAFAFLKERSVVVPAGGRSHAAASATPFEDAMVEYHALREKGPEG
ncbi:MAG: hypothetical protein JNK58_08890 [Phycisphaerae bacterium]|nr:hypothetical protein [Phycisphaerae bacterium]